ncbi:soluble guanylate cyclase 89Db-like [Littorina saxatilis]
MYGLLLESIQHYVKEQHGEVTWQRVLERAGLHNMVFTTHRQYSDQLMVRLAAACSALLPHVLPSEQRAMHYFGTCFVEFGRVYGYDKILRVAGRHYRDFLHGIDNLHETIRFSYHRMQSPSFMVEAEDREGCVLVYRSGRRGFAHYVMGQLQQCALQLYHVTVLIRILAQHDTEAGCLVRYRLDFNNAAYRPVPPPGTPPTSVNRRFDTVPGSLLFQLFPFCIVFNENLTIKRVGPSAVNFLGNRYLVGESLTSVFLLRRPLVEFTWSNIVSLQNVIFELEAITEPDTHTARGKCRPQSQPSPCTQALHAHVASRAHPSAATSCVYSPMHSPAAEKDSSSIQPSAEKDSSSIQPSAGTRNVTFSMQSSAPKRDISPFCSSATTRDVPYSACGDLCSTQFSEIKGGVTSYTEPCDGEPDVVYPRQPSVQTKGCLAQPSTFARDVVSSSVTSDSVCSTHSLSREADVISPAQCSVTTSSAQPVSLSKDASSYTHDGSPAVDSDVTEPLLSASDVTEPLLSASDRDAVSPTHISLIERDPSSVADTDVDLINSPRHAFRDSQDETCSTESSLLESDGQSPTHSSISNHFCPLLFFRRSLDGKDATQKTTKVAGVKCSEQGQTVQARRADSAVKTSASQCRCTGQDTNCSGGACSHLMTRRAQLGTTTGGEGTQLADADNSCCSTVCDRNGTSSAGPAIADDKNCWQRWAVVVRDGGQCAEVNNTQHVVGCQVGRRAVDRETCPAVGANGHNKPLPAEKQTNYVALARTRPEANSRKKTCKKLVKGQMKLIPEWGHIVFLCTPLVSNLEELQQQGIYLNDLNMYDNSRDLVLQGHNHAPLLESLMEQQVAISNKIRENLKALDKERTEGNTLLYSMLPETIAVRLKQGENPINTCQTFDAVTILFSYLVGFKDICSNGVAMDVVRVINNSFAVFDPIVDKYSLYKVETLGDAVYMVAGGVPEKTDHDAQRVAYLALDFIAEAHRVKCPIENKSLTVRIGMHTGSIVAGIVGKRTPQYCLFGDTVNTAARLQSHSLPGRIHLSEPCHQCLKNTDLVSVYRGQVNVKGKGMLKTYWLAGRRGARSTHNNLLLFHRERDQHLASRPAVGSVDGDLHALHVSTSSSVFLTGNTTSDDTDLARDATDCDDVFTDAAVSATDSRTGSTGLK